MGVVTHAEGLRPPAHRKPQPLIFNYPITKLPNYQILIRINPAMITSGSQAFDLQLPTYQPTQLPNSHPDQSGRDHVGKSLLSKLTEDLRTGRLKMQDIRMLGAI